MRLIISIIFVALLSVASIPALADQFEGVRFLANRRTIRTRFGKRIALIKRSMWCLENVPLFRGRAAYRTSV